MARLSSRVECCPSDLLTCSRHDREPAPQPPSVEREPLSPGAVKAPLTRRRIASLSFGALRLEAGPFGFDVEAPGTTGHSKDLATDPLDIHANLATLPGS